MYANIFLNFSIFGVYVCVCACVRARARTLVCECQQHKTLKVLNNPVAPCYGWH